MLFHAGNHRKWRLPPSVLTQSLLLKELWLAEVLESCAHVSYSGLHSFEQDHGLAFIGSRRRVQFFFSRSLNRLLRNRASQ